MTTKVSSPSWLNRAISFSIMLFSIPIFCSCTNSSQVKPSLLSELNQSFTNSTNILRKGNTELYNRISSLTTDAQFSEQVSIWYPKTRRIKETTEMFYNYIETAKLSYESNGDVVPKDSLLMKLNLFKNNYKETDSLMPEYLKTDLENIRLPLSSINHENAFLILSKLQNDITVIEHNTLRYFYLKFGYIHDDFSVKYGIILNQNSKHFKPGEELEISAGIGAISSAAQPKFSVNGLELKIEDNGLFVYKLKITSDTGKHTVPIIIEFYEPDGTKKKDTIIVQYNVITN